MFIQQKIIKWEANIWRNNRALLVWEHSKYSIEEWFSLLDFRISIPKLGDF